MSKFNVKIKNNQLQISAKLNKNQQINNRDISVFNTKVIRGLIRPNVIASNKITYISPKAVSLSIFLKNGIIANDYYLLIVQMCEIIKQINKNGLNVNNLNLDLDTMYIHPATKELICIYLPLVGDTYNNNIFEFFYQISSLSIQHTRGHSEYIEGFVTFLRNQQYFYANEVEDYISKVYPPVYDQIKVDKTGHSQVLYSKKLNYLNSQEEQSGVKEDTFLLDEEDIGDVTSLLEENLNDVTNLLEEEGTSLLIEEVEEEEGTSLLIEEVEEEEGTSLLVEEVEEEEGTSLLIEEVEEEEGTSLLIEEVEEEEGTSLLIEDEIDEDGTSLLIEGYSSKFDFIEDDEGTKLLEEDELNYPYLVNLNTYDRIEITKLIFRIGKEKKFVDYYIANNNAVSRVHADIITKNKKYYVRDNNSTNRTFINGTIIPVNQEVEIIDGDVVMLANEAFAFHID